MDMIVQREHPVLREKAGLVKKVEIGTPRFNTIISDMKKALHSQDDGVAIAAPQIGVPLRIFIVSGKVFDMRKKNPPTIPTPDLICINPHLTKLSKEKKWVPEGCLSVRYLYGRVERSTRATLDATNEQGQPFTLGASGLLAQIFQHEVDHLDGILFTDKAKDVEDIPPNYDEE